MVGNSRTAPAKLRAAAVAANGNGFTVPFSGDAVRMDETVEILLREVAARLKHGAGITVTGYATQSGPLDARVERARTRAVEVRQGLVNAGIRPVQVRTIYRTDCCWLGEPTSVANNRVSVEIDAGRVIPADAEKFGGGEGL
ncbi:MAG: hypothetical protein ABL931_01540 [Usitatibacteraceae bacterium]